MNQPAKHDSSRGDMWAWVRMGEIVNGQIGKGGRPRKNLAPDCKVSKELCDDLGISRRTLSNYQLAARLNEQTSFDARRRSPSQSCA